MINWVSWWCFVGGLRGSVSQYGTQGASDSSAVASTTVHTHHVPNTLSQLSLHEAAPTSEGQLDSAAAASTTARTQHVPITGSQMSWHEATPATEGHLTPVHMHHVPITRAQMKSHANGATHDVEVEEKVEEQALTLLDAVLAAEEPWPNSYLTRPDI